MERTAMSTRDLRRAAVFGRVKHGELPLTEAAGLVGLSYRQTKRVYALYRARGARGLVHGNVGRRSNHAWSVADEERVVALIRSHYSGPAAKGPGQRFGPTLVSEHLASEHGIRVAVTTVTRRMRTAGLWGRARKAGPKHVRRERRAHFGELVQLDGSFHDWFEGRGPRACVMTMVDDATGRTLLRFGAEETTWAAAEMLERWIAAYGVPRALYTDWKNVYRREPTTNERARGEAALTQFGRMCEKLGVELIGAASPQAKGRVERGHGTHQDRLVKKLRLEGIADYAAANAYVEAEYLPAHNARFAVVPASAVDYHLPRDRSRWPDEAVFCLEATRVVGQDHVVQYEGRSLQLDPRARGRVPAKSRVLVRETRDGRVHVVQVAHLERGARERALAWTPAVPRARKPPPPAAAPAPRTGSGATGAARWVPAADHPWRQQHRQWSARSADRKDAHPAAPAAPHPPSPRGHFYWCKQGDISIGA